MKTTEVNENIIGKRCKCMFTGTIEAIEFTEHAANVKVRFDQPHQWGDHH